MTEEMKPRSLIWLCDVPFNNDYKHVLTFNERISQLNYFDSKAKIKLSKYTYVRKDSSIVVEAPFDEVKKLNYIVFSNNVQIDDSGYTFGFIINIEYVSENSTRIYYDTDVFQTHQFNIVYRKTFVEREHVSSDAVGEHTVPETLDLGDYVINKHYRDTADRTYRSVLMSSVDLDSTSLQSSLGGVYNGIPTGFKLYSFSTDGNDLSNVLQRLTDAGKADAILSIYMAPTWLAGTNRTVADSSVASTIDMYVDTIDALDGYVPKNNKLLTYPYCYYLLSNNQGNDAILKRELWRFPDTSTRQFNIKIRGALCSGCSIRAIPFNYNGDDMSNINGISLGKYPQIGYACDAYINWLTQNALNIVNNSLDAGANMLQRNYAGVGNNIISSLYMGVMGDRIPPQIVGNTNSGDIMTSTNENCFHVYTMTIKREFAKIIDNYFNMYGYEVNELKEPDILSRPNWNYLKTINCNFTGVDIPEKDMETIKSIFDNGVTLWHHANTMYNYDADNSI